MRAVRKAYNAMEFVGTTGTIDELWAKSLLTSGTILESNDFIDSFLDGFNARLYLTSCPVIVLSRTRANGRDLPVGNHSWRRGLVASPEHFLNLNPRAKVCLSLPVTVMP